MNKILIVLFVVFCACNEGKKPIKETIKKDTLLTEKVNVFLGTSGDNGQLSPAASSPFNMLSIGPQTYPHIHTGYEHLAKTFLGFTHTRLEGIGGRGSGGNILIKPILDEDINTLLTKKAEQAAPGFYSVGFENGIKTNISVKHNFGIENFSYPKKDSKKGIYIDLSFAFNNRFIAEQHSIENEVIKGWIDTKTVGNRGVYRIYYAIKVENNSTFNKIDAHKYIVNFNSDIKDTNVFIGFSSVNSDYAYKNIQDIAIDTLRNETSNTWNSFLSRVKVKGEKDREDLFYSLLYRTMQAPYLISEKDGVYRAIDGSLQKENHPIYNGWSIWDNYREQLPLLSLLYPNEYKDIAKSIANLYPYGKKDWSTMAEPSPTVRTEHAIVVLLDAYKKGYSIDFNKIKDGLITEAKLLNFNTPDKALESSYDLYAMSEIMKILKDPILSEKYKNKALEYKAYWKKDFLDLSKPDVDNMHARGLYQGTIWQYRWFVPYDIDGLKEIAGGEVKFLEELDQFFSENNYNHANQPDLQVPGIYNATSQPWKSQKLFRNILLDTVIQNYFNDNSKGIGAYIGKIYKNAPQAYIRTMDDDSGTMSSWFVLRSMGISPATVGSPVYYITAPIFKSVVLDWENGQQFTIDVKNYNKDNFYIKSVTLNGEELDRNWLTHQEIIKGGHLVIETSNSPNKKWGIKNQWVSKLN